MELIRTEGIVLHSFPYRDYDQILTVYSKDQGLVKLIMKGARSKRRGIRASLEPLSEAEFLFRVGKSDLYALQEISILNLHLNLRESLSLLQSACALLQAVQRTQIQGNPSPALYQLISRYLKQFANSKNPDVLISSFLLKLLTHEGLLHLEDHCSVCAKPLLDRVIIGGESFCKAHAPTPTLTISQVEANLLHFLSNSRSFNEIEQVQISQATHHQIHVLFESLFQ